MIKGGGRQGTESTVSLKQMTIEQQIQYKRSNQFTGMSSKCKLPRRQSNFSCGSVPSCFANCFQNSWYILEPVLIKLKLREIM